MVSVILFVIAIIFTICHLAYKKEWHYPKSVETFLSYILFFNMGLMGLLGAYAHVFMAAETARSIGWAPGSPFQLVNNDFNFMIRYLLILNLFAFYAEAYGALAGGRPNAFSEGQNAFAGIVNPANAVWIADRFNLGAFWTY